MLNATVLALALDRGPVNPLLTNDPGRIRALFQKPGLCWMLDVDPQPPDRDTLNQTIVGYLEEQERRQAWISENKNG